MKNIIYPYPFKLSTTGDLSDGPKIRKQSQWQSQLQ